CHAASEIILPVIIACIFKLLLQPAMRLMERCHLPRLISAILLMAALLGMLVILSTGLSVPARSWAQKLPSDLSVLQERITTIRAPLKPIEKILDRAEDMTGPSDRQTIPVVMKGDGLSERLYA